MYYYNVTTKVFILTSEGLKVLCKTHKKLMQNI